LSRRDEERKRERGEDRLKLLYGRNRIWLMGDMEKSWSYQELSSEQKAL